MTAIQVDYEGRCHNGSDIHEHLPYLFRRASRKRCQVLELGVRSGESTAAFLAAVEHGGGHVWSVDVHMPGVPNVWFENPRWTFSIGDDLDPEVAALQPDELDLLFIDTNHRYQHTVDELDLYGVRVRSGGVILLHDTELDIASEQPGPEDYDYPVRRAVVDWCRQRFLDPTWRDGCWGLGVIEVT